MANKIKWANAEERFKTEFKNNSEYKYITVDADGTVCAWYDKPEYDNDREDWLGGDFLTIGRICDVPDYIEYDELIYTRDNFIIECDPSTIEVKEFNALEMRKLSDTYVQSILHTNVRSAVEHAARIGSYSTFCWLEWIPALYRAEKAAEITLELQQLGFIVFYDEDNGRLDISW